MNNITATLEGSIKQAFVSFTIMRNEAKDLSNLYFKGSVSSDLSALAGTDPATFNTLLTKDQLINGLTIAEQYDKMFDNVAVATADYLTTVETNTHGNAVATSISPAVEAFGDRSTQFCRDLLTQYNRSRKLENIYNASELSAMIGSLSVQTVLYGANMTKDDLTSAITLIQQFQNFMTNVAVTTADYKITLGKWERF